MTIPSPTKDAPPSEVRSYFTSLLTTHHEIPEAEAQKVVSKWRYGRGSEMGSYDIETYRELFGTELGTILYGHSHQHFVKPSTLESSDLDKDRDGKGSILGVTPVGALAWLFSCLLVALAVNSFNEVDEQRWLMMAYCFFTWVVLVTVWCLFWVGSVLTE